MNETQTNTYEESRIQRMQEAENEIDLVELAMMLIGKFKAILFCTLLCAVVLNAYTYLMVDPTYESTATLYVVSASNGGVVDLTDLNIGSSLKDDYRVLIQRYPVLSRTIEELSLDITPEILQKKMRIENPTDTRILTITITDTDPAMARDIANKVAEISTEYLPDVMSSDAPNIAEHARIAEHKSGPSYSKATIMGGLIGFILACMYFIVMFLMDNTVKTDDELERLTGAMPLATIPYSKVMDSKSTEFSAELLRLRSEEHELGKLHVHVPKLPFMLEEELGRLQVNVKFSGESTKTIMVTSSVANEGKSSISVNLWKMLAEAGMKTVLLDLDIRNSVFKETLGYKYDTDEIKGIHYYLSGQATYEEVLYKTNVKNGYIIPCIQLLQNPTSLLQDKCLKEMVDRLEEEFDYIIVDTAPLLLAADGEIISQLCDGAVMVVRSEMTHKEDVRRSIVRLERSGCPVLGTVLNAVHMEGKPYGKYGKYGRYGGYGGYGNYGGYNRDEEQ